MKWYGAVVSAWIVALPLPALAQAPAAPAAGTAAQTQGAAPAAEDAHVARAVFTTGIKDREPVDSVTTVSGTQTKVYFFTEIRGLSGHTVTHRWEFGGKPMASVEFHIGGPRWRVWSSKTLLPRWKGDWQVAVVDQDGKVLDTKTFSYTGH